MTQDGDPRRIRAIVVLGDDSAEERLDAEHREELRRHLLRREPSRIAIVGQRQRSRPPRREPLERGALGLPVHPVGRRHRHMTAGRPDRLARLDAQRFVDHHEAVAPRIRQRPQQQLIDDGKDRGVAADAEREREDDGNREAGTRAQAAHHVSGVARQILDEARGSHVVAALLEPPHVAEARACRARGLLLAHPGSDVLLAERLEVKPHLAIHLAVAAAPGERCEDASQAIRHSERHVRPPARWRAERA
jgi:hypothetical protein